MWARFSINRVPTWTLVLILILSAASFVILWFVGNTASTSDSQIVPTSELPIATSSEIYIPTKLTIPRIGVDALVELKGLTLKGNLQTPSSFKTTAWYTESAKPGLPGAAVIVGHVDNGLGLAAVFYRLHELLPGDIIYVQNKEGREEMFVVVRTKVYAYNEKVPSDIFDAPSGTSALNLITCSGSWIPALRMYDQRLVVYAVENSQL